MALVLLTTFFVVYTWHRRKSQKRLAAAHQQLETAHAELQTAYNQLEETTAAKERIESELRIARDIQMSMVPGVFPERDGLDMFASMTPAKEVGGDLSDSISVWAMCLEKACLPHCSYAEGCRRAAPCRCRS